MRAIAILPKRNLFDADKIGRVIENALNETALAVQADFGVTAQTWHHQPGFDIRRAKGERIVSTSDRIYGFVNNGTRVRRALMSPDFQAKSRHRYIGSNAGRGGVVVVKRTINRPGIQAREFDKAIAEKWEREFGRQMQRAIDAEF